ncbi:MAG: hypothetical protein HY884_10570 [Deltaproteobacteria bacterium]|nr:hypothetical protein [Deltaproteobacteria bacterium]
MDSPAQLIAAYEKKTRTVKEFMNKAVGLTGEYRKEQEEMIEEIRDGLAHRDGLRKKDFDSLMEGIVGRRQETEKGIQDALEALWKDEKEIIKALSNVLTTGKTVGIETLKKERLPLLHKKEEGVARLLMRLHLEQAELSIALKQLLSKGENAGIKDLKTFVKAIDVRRKERDDGMDGIFEKWGRVRLDVIAKWHGVFGAYERTETGQGTGF